MEAEILREAPEIDSILTHIESEPATIEQPEVVAEAERRIGNALAQGGAQIPDIKDVHEFTVSRSGDHIYLSCHCTMPDDLPLQRVHEAITALEDRFKLEHPGVYRVTIHPEPMTDNTR